MERYLREPILDDGILNPHYFEGRVLTSTALLEDQEAHRTRQRRLGRAIGAGVVDGLWVRPHATGSPTTTPVLSVGCGLAVNGNGQTVALPADELLALSEPIKEEIQAEALFHDCVPPSVGVETTGEGFYVLVMSPASGYQGKAPMSGLGDTKAGDGCGSRWAVEGVVLRLEPVDPLTVSGTSQATRDLLASELLGATDDSSLSKLRNVVAHLCFGTEQSMGFPADSFARDSAAGGGVEPATRRYGALDDLRQAGRIGACDVPLAVLYWRLDGLAFVDNWSARRRPVQPATEENWPVLSNNRSRAETEAALFQFQDQLAELVATHAIPSTLSARDRFRWLPAAGILPLSTPEVRGVTRSAFFTGLMIRNQNLYMDGGRLRELLAVSLDQPPVSTQSAEMLWTYRVRHNHPPPPPGAGENPYLVFASGTMPYAGTARFDVARWDRSNIGLL